MLAVRNDVDLDRLLKDVMIPNAGIRPGIPRVLNYTTKERKMSTKLGLLPAASWSEIVTFAKQSNSTVPSPKNPTEY